MNPCPKATSQDPAYTITKPRKTDSHIGFRPRKTAGKLGDLMKRSGLVRDKHGHRFPESHDIEFVRYFTAPSLSEPLNL